MATGTGKTFTAVDLICRLLKSGLVRRVLFLVDRPLHQIRQFRNWASLQRRAGAGLRDHYTAALQELGKQTGLLGDIFAGALSRFREPVNLCFSREALAARDDNLDLFWLRDASLDDPNDLPELEDLVGEALTRLETAMDALNELAAALEMNEPPQPIE